MAESLGLYIEDKLIKYAKISKNNDAIKVESFGTKFFDDFDKTIKQIIDETYSYKTPICINASEEIYNKFEIFSLLSHKDIQEVVKTEFEGACYDNNTSPNVYEQRTVYSNQATDNDKVHAISIAVPKTVIEQKKRKFNNKIQGIFAESVSLQNLIKKEKKSNQLIINIENSTTITQMKNGYIYNIETIDIGMKNIIENIQQKENSYSKSYEICKNTTIYLDSGKDLEYEENEYLVDIMPVLYQLVTEIRKIVDNTLENIDKIYITGSAAIINNIDIYFQDYLKNIPCELLKPSFINNNSKINMKDYIEVNSAIALAVSMVNKDSNYNFINESTFSKLEKIFKSEIHLSNFKINIDSLNFESKKASFSYLLIISVFISYILISTIINKQINNKSIVAQQSIDNSCMEIENIIEYKKKFDSRIDDYKKMIKNIEDANNVYAENKRYKNAIPNLLNNIMVVIPKDVRLDSIENSSDSHIIIVARSKRYEELAFFKTKLQTEEILKNVKSDAGTVCTSGTEEDKKYIIVTIEGELP